MTFPTVPTAAAGRIVDSANTSPAGTHTFPNLNTLTAPAGDLIIALCIIYDGNSTNAEFSSWGGGFTEFVDQATTTTMGIGAAYKWSSGSETGTFTVTSADTSTNDSVCILLSIAGAHASTPPEGGTIGNGTAAAAAIAAVSPSWGADDTLWIAVCGAGETSTTGAFTAPSAAPTNYTDLDVTALTADVVGGVYGAVAFRQLNAASEDPDNFTVDTSNARNSALLIAVRPAFQPVGDPYQRDPRWYRANIFFRPSGEAFQTLGDATAPAGVTPITLDDAGAATDSITIAADVPLSDTGAGADAITVDTGTDQNQAAPRSFPPFTAPFVEPQAKPFQTLGDASGIVQVSLSDAGAGDDTLAVSAAVPLDDTGAGTDSISVSTGTDPNQAWPQFEPHLIRPGAQPFQTLGDRTAASAPVQITLDDSGTATDTLSVTVADQNQAGPQAAWMFLEPNAASFQLAGDTSPTTQISLTDTGAASDALTVSAAVPLSDTAAGDDTLSVSAAIPLSDAGAGADAVSIAADVPLTDTAAGADSISVQVLGEPDPYQTAPLPFQTFTAPFLEPHAKPFQLLGDASGVAQVSLTDSGIGDDALSISATLPLSDTATGTDTLSIGAAVPLSDAAIGSDGVALTAAVPLADAAAGDDALSVLVQIVIDANQAIPKRFGWAFQQPGWVIPFQMLGSREAAPGLVNATSTPTVTAGYASAATVTSGTTSTATVSASATSTPSVSDG